jgi:LPXTG-site transpeptidase (sortase) family protein
MDKPILPILNLRRKIDEGEIQPEETRTSLNLKAHEPKDKADILKRPLLSSLSQKPSGSQSDIKDQESEKVNKDRDSFWQKASGFSLKKKKYEKKPYAPDIPAKKETEAQRQSVVASNEIEENKNSLTHPDKEKPSQAEAFGTSPSGTLGTLPKPSRLFKKGDHKKRKSRWWSRIKSFVGFVFLFLIIFFGIFLFVIQPQFVVRQWDYYFGDNEEFEKVEQTLIKLDQKPKIIKDIERGEATKDGYVLEDESPAIITPEEDYTRNRIVIPDLKIDAPITTTGGDNTTKAINEALRDGVVHYPGMAFPGEVGNVFFTGHSSNYSWAQGDYNYVFATLIHAKKDMRIIIYFNKKKYVYKVADKFEVGANDTWVLRNNPQEIRYPERDEEPESLLTLMTCTPPGTDWRRLIIWAEEDPEYMQVTEGQYTDSSIASGTDRLLDFL